MGLGGLQSECVHGGSDAQNCLSGLVVGRGRAPLWSFVQYPDLDQTLGGHAALVSSGRTFISQSRELLRLISCGRGGATVQHNTKQSETARLATHSNNKHRTESQMSLKIIQYTNEWFKPLKTNSVFKMHKAIQINNAEWMFLITELPWWKPLKINFLHHCTSWHK